LISSVSHSVAGGHEKRFFIDKKHLAFIIALFGSATQPLIFRKRF